MAARPLVLLPAGPALEAHVNSPVVRLADICPEAFRHVREHRDVNTVVLRLSDGLLDVEAEANWTPEELLAKLTPDQARLIIHEVPYATPTGARRHAHLLIWWMPPAAAGDEAAYAPAYDMLKTHCTDAPVPPDRPHHRTAGLPAARRTLRQLNTARPTHRRRPGAVPACCGDAVPAQRQVPSSPPAHEPARPGHRGGCGASGAARWPGRRGGRVGTGGPGSAGAGRGSVDEACEA
ncbi:hypothetical protein [Streptomyces sp. NPDC097619]|uniref:hypothetical protein n=1 Tax=Streptomyces sp. NPDC097619 TaxID=3157228 RepID=UPI003317EC37